LRARPEQTQLEDLSDASFLGKLLVLPANVRLNWKVIAKYKHSSFFGLFISNEEKKFYNIDTWNSSQTPKATATVSSSRKLDHFINVEFFCSLAERPIFVRKVWVGCLGYLVLLIGENFLLLPSYLLANL
jgi:hypothetical protein